MSLRLRVALFMALLVAAAAVAVSWAAYASAQHEARSGVDQTLRSRVGFAAQPPGGPGGMPVLGEPVLVATVVGGAVILVGVWLVNRTPGTEAAAPEVVSAHAGEE